MIRALLLHLLVPVREIDSAAVAAALRRDAPVAPGRSWSHCARCRVLVAGAHTCSRQVTETGKVADLAARRRAR